MLLCGSDIDVINWIISKLSAEFQMKNLGSPRQYMGLNINVNRSSCVTTINQTDYIDKILKRFNMTDCNPIATPMEVRLGLESVSDQPTQQLYRGLLGSLMYLMLGTRPDICFAIGYLSRFQELATDAHYKCLKRVLRYVKGSKHLALVYRRCDAPILLGWVDADWANCTDTRRSTSGFMFKVFGNTVIWSSRRQTLVTLSTTEAEYIAATVIVHQYQCN